MKTYIINIKTREDRRLLMDIQLRDNGLMIIPLEDKEKKQKIFTVRKTKNNYFKKPLVPVKFVPLVEGKV